MLFLFISYTCFGQNTFTAVVKNETTGLVMPSVHILNLTQVIGTITDQKGGQAPHFPLHCIATPKALAQPDPSHLQPIVIVWQ